MDGGQTSGQCGVTLVSTSDGVNKFGREPWQGVARRGPRSGCPCDRDQGRAVVRRARSLHDVASSRLAICSCRTRTKWSLTHLSTIRSIPTTTPRMVRSGLHLQLTIELRDAEHPEAGQPQHPRRHVLLTRRCCTGSGQRPIRDPHTWGLRVHALGRTQIVRPRARLLHQAEDHVATRLTTRHVEEPGNRRCDCCRR